MRNNLLGALGACLLLSCVGPSSAPALTSAAPGFQVNAVAGPTVFSAEHDGSTLPDSYMVTVANSGSRPTDGTPIAIAMSPSAGLVVKGVVAESKELSETNGYTRTRSLLPCVTSTSSAVCTYESSLRPGERLYMDVEVSVKPGTVGPVTSSVSVSGGGAATVSRNVETAVGTAAESQSEPFGLAFFDETVTGANGATDMQAGDHPFETSLSYSLNTVDLNGEESYVSGGGLGGEPARTKDVVVNLPPGFVGNPDVVERCPQGVAIAGKCPLATQIGVASIVIFGRHFDGRGNVITNNLYNEPIYNVMPDKGFPAQFEFSIERQIPVVLQVRTNQGTNYGVQVLATGIPAGGPPVDVSVTFFGTPSTDPNVENELGTSGLGAGMTHTAFLSNPVDCSTKPQVSKLLTDSWQRPGRWLSDGSPDVSDPNWHSYTTTLFPEITGCNLLQFNPALTVTPEASQVDSPSGVTVGLSVPQAQQMTPDLATPELKDATVTLPLGLSVSPSAADGLQGCSDAQIALSSPTPASCPLASQIGTVKITTPLLSEPLEGQVFLGTPHCNPCTNADASDGNMFRIFMQAQGSGVVVKKQGTVYANTTTGQLTTTFEDNPELPFSNLQLVFKGGLRAALATPQTCGTFTTTSDLTPWSAPVTPDATPSSPFNIDWDGNGGACPALPRFAPSFSAGTSNPNAGQFSPLTLTFGRQDREQDLAAIQVRTPPGLLGMLSSVTLCGEPQADLGTCGEASRIGSMTVAAGPGSHPFYEKGSIYLTGPYAGAPFGLSIVVPTVAGPFNLGNVVVRAKINVDVHTAALTVTSDPLPQILDGIPLRLRTTNVTIDRPGFIFNPTNCAQQKIEATIAGAQGAQASLAAPFAVAGCAGIHFGPKFVAATAGHTSRAKGASLDVKLVYPTGAQSNITKVKVDLPRQLPSRLSTLQHACPDGVFNANPAACPRASLIGTAKAISPVLPVPLVGPAYFVSHAGAAFPDLVVILEGYGVRIDLVGSTFITSKGITSSTFQTVPDVPVSSFELSLPQGPYSALAANTNLCKTKLLMPTRFVAQDGAELRQATRIKATGCPKAKKTRKTKPKKTKKAGAARSAGSTHTTRGRDSR